MKIELEDSDMISDVWVINDSSSTDARAEELKITTREVTLLFCFLAMMLDIAVKKALVNSMST